MPSCTEKKKLATTINNFLGIPLTVNMSFLAIFLTSVTTKLGQFAYYIVCQISTYRCIPNANLVSLAAFYSKLFQGTFVTPVTSKTDQSCPLLNSSKMYPGWITCANLVFLCLAVLSHEQTKRRKYRQSQIVRYHTSHVLT